MSLSLARLPPLRTLSSIHHQHLLLLLPAAAPLTVPRRGRIQGEYRRPGQPKEDKFPWQKINFSFSKGLEGIKKHFNLLKNEFSERWVGPEGKPIIEHMLEQNRVVWEFRGSQGLEEWTLSSDKEIGGQSEIYLKLGRNNNTCFLYGTLCSTPPRDGETRYSGYCTMRSKKPLVGAASSVVSRSGFGLGGRKNKRKSFLKHIYQIKALIFLHLAKHMTWKLFAFFLILILFFILY